MIGGKSPLLEFSTAQVEAVREVAVVGVEEQGGLVKPKAFIVVTDGQAAGEELGRPGG